MNYTVKRETTFAAKKAGKRIFAVSVPMGDRIESLTVDEFGKVSGGFGVSDRDCELAKLQDLGPAEKPNYFKKRDWALPNWVCPKIGEVQNAPVFN